ncbi:DUF1573 domain-containing protein [Paraflavitalea sp. CAU 1676]|uniref:DUF1573 domain-containing protein n=1 Tax=Paraflavitalea sp. CAU 1676 TaxID=3032598 RepID=UPI0023DBE666|nr:DUF1573 domain-containing protein [Paraflavitalea sp. CAU 1676]MDF2189705.1 DUF1573 domain-containing protein [Paraflavitalea sp. CAU 1676]
MKSFLLAASALLLSVTMFAQAPATSGQKAADVLKFKEITHDFGKIKQNVPVTYDFVFSNAGGKPVVIESAIASCGCTTPVKPEAPVGKGKQDKITAGFNAQVLGVFTKSITIKVAGIDTPMEIRITGEVLNEVDFAKYEKEKGSRKSK